MKFLNSILMILLYFFSIGSTFACGFAGQIINNTDTPLILGSSTVLGALLVNNILSPPLPNYLATPLSAKSTVTFIQASNSWGQNEGGIGVPEVGSGIIDPCLEVGWGGVCKIKGKMEVLKNSCSHISVNIAFNKGYVITIDPK